MKTTVIPIAAPAWYLLDAEGQPVGRLAAQITCVLRGKHKPSFAPHQLCGDVVVVINAAKVAVEPRKLLQKEYVTHTGYLGHRKAVRMRDMLERHPDRVIRHAVQGMLPKNRLRPRMLARLHVFADAEHTHAAQQPAPFPARS